MSGIDRELTEDERQRILKIDSNDITISFIVDLFAKPSYSDPPKHSPNDYFKLPKERFNLNRKVRRF